MLLSLINGSLFTRGLSTRPTTGLFASSFVRPSQNFGPCQCSPLCSTLRKRCTYSSVYQQGSAVILLLFLTIAGSYVWFISWTGRPPYSSTPACGTSLYATVLLVLRFITLWTPKTAATGCANYSYGSGAFGRFWHATTDS
ncbi:hypothetical protein EXIGLDRAFT_496682 [Exidia glandulosa HHB12029]|uniref:Uncharacterized protein n=1 Tax=Exidia glandulosa HHB12029 TaxID=1314781 RepID=A0A165JHK0_EXIGL|nr:hypothetical protein EXIGLDRAFT_496682 [Exidia glandulosa HHB12029]